MGRKIKPPELPDLADLNQIPLKVLGLSQDLQNDLKALKIYTLGDLKEAMERTNGSFVSLSRPTHAPSVIVTTEESVELYKTVLNHPLVSPSWKEDWEETPTDEQSPQEIPAEVIDGNFVSNEPEQAEESSNNEPSTLKKLAIGLGLWTE